jgi:hypothetical protein
MNRKKKMQNTKRQGTSLVFEPYMSQATLVLKDVFALLEKLVWPVFLWCSLRSKTVNAHIEKLLGNGRRLSKIKGFGVEATFTPEPFQGFPSDELESEVPSRSLRNPRR